MKVTFEPLQIELPEPDAILTAGVTLLLMVIVIGLEVAVGVLEQVALEVSTHVTTLPLVRVEVV